MKLHSPIYLFLVSICLLDVTPKALAEFKPETRQHSKISQINKDDDKDEEFLLPELKGIPKNINKIAEKITVRIDSPNGNGSGVIFARDDDKYYVVTAKHVVEREQSYQVVTEDKETYEVESEHIDRFENTDLAIVSFISDKDYQVAAFSDYNLGLNKEAWVFAYGWAGDKSEPEPLFTVGKVVGKESGILLVKDDLSLNKTSGYELIYTNLSERGMSGGPVLDTNGRVIGIHTSAEGERYRLTNKLQLGFSLGIPIATFLESSKLQDLVTSNYLELETIQEKADAVPFSQPNLSREELDSIGFLYNAPADNATETEWVNYGNQLWRSALYTDAIKAFDRAIASSTNFHQAYYGKGLTLYDLGKYRAANEAFQQALDLEANFYPALYRQSLTLLALAQYSSALEIIDRTIALKPGNTALYVLRGQALQNLNRYDEAIAAYNKALAANNNPLILTRRGSIYRILGKPDLAFQDFNRAIESDPRYAEGYINRALTYYQLENYRQALINLNHVISAITREDPRAYLARGFVYQQLGEDTQAKADFVRAFNLDRIERKIQADGGEVNLQADEYSHINTDFQHIMQISPDSGSVYFGRGVAYLLLNDRKQAISDLTQAQKSFETSQDRYSKNLARRIITQAQQPIEQTSTTAEEAE